MRLINADEFKVFAFENRGYEFDTPSEAYAQGVEYVLEKIDEEATVNSIPVVRCKDCEYNCSGYCIWHEFNPREDDFCSKGEKK